MGELADVAGPRVRANGLARRRLERHEVLAGALAHADEREVDDQVEVVATVAERGEVHRDDREAEVEVRAELAFGNHLLEVAVGRGDDADVDRRVGVGTDRAHDALFEDAEELGLRREGQVTDLVEEQRAALGREEAAGARVHRTREGALHVTEQLGFDESLGQRGAVDRDERLGAAVRRAVRGAGEQLFARAGLAGDQDAAVRVGHATDGVEGIDDLRRLAHDFRSKLPPPHLEVTAHRDEPSCD
jgi:hypothetical protein